MGDYSRDTFRLTNILHQLTTGDTVADARHYVGVRQQQGVPLLDADWNELEDIRRFESQLALSRFFGDGIPEASDGFRVGPVTEDNDFSVSLGLAMVDGMLVYNPHGNLTYVGQAEVLGWEPDELAPPGVGTRNDLVYLDVFEVEVQGITAGAEEVIGDDRLLNEQVGVETCVRRERRWRVRVAEGAESMDEIVTEGGHAYMPLAMLRRAEAQPQIQTSRIIDRRRTGINVSRHLKIPVHVQRGSIVVDGARLANVGDTLRNLLFSRLASGRLFLDTSSVEAQVVLQSAVQHALQTCSSTALQARTENLTHDGALAALEMLAAAQHELTAAVRTYGIEAGGDRDAFADDYDRHLEDLDDANDEDDLVSAYQAQQQVNAWLALQEDELPEGSVSVEYLSVVPDEPLVADTLYTFTVEVTSQASSEDTSEEIFDVRASLSSSLWSVDPPEQSVVLANDGGSATVTFDVTPNAGNATSDFEVVGEARRNPSGVRSTQPGIPLEIGELPPVGRVLSYAGIPLNEDDQLEITEAQISGGLGFNVNFALSNYTDQDLTFQLEWYLEIDGDDTGWGPLESSPATNEFDVVADTRDVRSLAIGGPSGAAGTTGTMHVTLTERGPVGGPLDEIPEEDREIVSVDFAIVTNPT